MKQLLEERTFPEEIFKQLFLQCVPSNTRVILDSTRESISLEELTELADKIAEVPQLYSTYPTVMPAVLSTSSFFSSTTASEISDLHSLRTQALQIQILMAQHLTVLSFGIPIEVAADQVDFGGRSRSPNASRNSKWNTNAEMHHSVFVLNIPFGKRPS